MAVKGELPDSTKIGNDIYFIRREHRRHTDIPVMRFAEIKS